MNPSGTRPGILFTLVGPAGAGKNRLIRYVLERTPLKQIPTATTRPIRPGEQEGREHFYVSVEEFKRMIAAGDLLEHQVIHGNLYGMLRSTIEQSISSGQSIIADIEVLGAAEARKAYPENVVSVFIQPPSVGTLIERMRERGEKEAEIGKRLLRVPMELDYACDCPYVIMNDSFERAADLLLRIVLTETAGERATVHSDTLTIYTFDFTASVIPVYREEALRRAAAPQEARTAVSRGEMPHDAALRLLHSELGISAEASGLLTHEKADGEFIPPTALEYSRDAAGEHVRYTYLYCLNQRIAAPDGWVWASVNELPEILRPAVFECAT